MPVERTKSGSGGGLSPYEIMLAFELNDIFPTQVSRKSS